MNNEHSRIKPWYLWTAMFVMMALLFHVIAETSVQLFFARRSGITKYLAEFKDKADKAGLTVEQYGRQVGLDPYMGWGGSEARIHEPSKMAVRPQTLLIIGDSVTAGHEVQAGVEDYPARMAEMFSSRGVRVVNLAARGYGIDQMWLKLLAKAGYYHPDMIVLAYIPHDLLRPATDFGFGLPKPKYQFSSKGIDLALAPGIKEFSEDYAAAKSGFRLSEWLLARYWKNRQYFFPGFFGDYYSRLYQHIGEGLARMSSDLGIPVVVVKLTNYHHFPAEHKLTDLAASALINPERLDKANVHYLDTDECVIAKAKEHGVELEKEFAHHPQAVGHGMLAECIGAYLQPLLIQAPMQEKPSSPNQSQ